jgi:isoleucyl-tRNA synthetase
VCEARAELASPADLYLEGSDQHRGWFQSSLLCAVGTRGHAPYKGVLTHGYVVDGQGKKMSKSIGNVVAPQEVIDKYGAEILRLWVASEDYRDDVKVSDQILGHVSDAYRKMRNTIRFMLSNLYDFDPVENNLPAEQMSELDRWVLAVYARLVETVTAAYLRYEFHTVYHRLHNFCVTTLSNLYLDILKDRLYASAADAPARRAAQTVIHRVLDGLLRMMAPVLTFTAAEAWDYLHGGGADLPVEQSVFFAEFPKVDDIEVDEAMLASWQRLLDIRGEITRVLEGARRDKIIGLSLDAEVLVQAEGETGAFLSDRWELLREICIVSNLRPVAAIENDSASRVVAAEEVPDLKIAVRPAPGSKCERCWTVAESVGRDQEHPGICERCAGVVRTLPA